MRRVHSTLLFLLLPFSTSSLTTAAQSQSGPQGGISGRVFDAQGKPSFQIEVRAVKAEAAEADPESVFAAERIYVYVDQDGRYNLQRLPPGRYILAVNADHRLPYPVTFYPGVQDISQAAAITVEADQQLQDINFLLDRPTLSPRLVEGTVVWADGSPAIGAHVNLLVAKYPWIAPGLISTDDKGRFSLYGYEGIKYLLHAWATSKNKEEIHAEPVEVSPAENTERIRLVLNAPGKGFPGRKSGR